MNDPYHYTDPPTLLKSAVMGRDSSKKKTKNAPVIDLEEENAGLRKLNANLKEQLTLALERVVVLENERRPSR